MSKSWLTKLMLVALLAISPAQVFAQGIGNGGGGGGGGNAGGNQGGFGGPAAAGVFVSPAGVLGIKRYGGAEFTLAAMKKWAAEAKTRLPGDLAKGSVLRKISLNRLEAVVKAKLEKGEPITDELRYLAGLTRVQYVFFYPETKDIVIAGPAEPYAADASGRVIGLDSGRAVVELQDLIVALRAYSPQGKATHTISVSIDPTQEGLQKMQQFLVSIQGRVRPGDADDIVAGLRENLGLQNVTIQGISPDTHFAQVLVEADYRMKLIGIGMETPPLKMASYVQNASPSDVSRNALTRWYFVPNYDSVHATEDHLAMEMVGEGVKLIGANELVGADGTRGSTDKGNKASELFCQAFTTKYGDLSRRLAVYAQLRNCIDLSIAAAYIQQQDFYTQAGWKMSAFQDEKVCSVETYETPKTVESACIAVWKGSRLMTPIGGGVVVQPTEALKSGNIGKDSDGKVKGAHRQVDLSKLGQNQWWWD